MMMKAIVHKIILVGTVLVLGVLSFHLVTYTDEDLLLTPSLRNTGARMPVRLSFEENILPRLKVLLVHARTVTIVAKSVVTVYDARSRVYLDTLQPGSLHVQPSDMFVMINKKRYHCAMVRLVSDSGACGIQSTFYPGEMLIRSLGDKVQVINDVDLEEYLKGVLPAEMFSKWPEEALKAQAVASRSYAVFTAVWRKGHPYHLRNTTASQVYRGVTVRTAATDRAVEKTTGQVLMYDNALFPTYFHSTCGGHTAAVEDVWWRDAHPALKSVNCPFCWESKHFVWEREFSKEDIAARLQQKKYFNDTIKDIRIGYRDNGGRALTFMLIGDTHTAEILANDFRVYTLGAQLKSTAVSLRQTDDSITFYGYGWGHGVGMCQWGANGMAEKGYDYATIISFYYPGTQIVTFTHKEEYDK